jgi:hypothetical protein
MGARFGKGYADVPVCVLLVHMPCFFHRHSNYNALRETKVHVHSVAVLRRCKVLYIIVNDGADDAKSVLHQ